MIVTTGTEYVAVIPARGGSKGVPGKNVRPVAGKPLLAWSVGHVREARTPCDWWSPPTIPTSRNWQSGWGPKCHRFDRLIWLPMIRRRSQPCSTPCAVCPMGSMYVTWSCCSPPPQFATRGRSMRPSSAYARSGCQSLLSVVESPPWLWSGTPERPVPLYDIDHRPRRQDVPPSERRYRETGSVYVTALAHLTATGNRLSRQPYMFVMRPHEGLDIDDEYDLRFADAWLRNAHSDLHNA